MKSGMRLLLRALSFMKKYQKKYILGLIFSSLELIILFAIPFLNKKLIELVSGSSENGTFAFIVAVFSGLLILIPFIALGRYWINIYTARGTIELRKAVFDHIQNLSIADSEEWKMGEIITRLTVDVNKTASLFQSYTIISLVKFLFVTTISLILLIVTDWRIAILSVLYNFLCFILATVLNPFVRRLENDSKKYISASSSYVLEAMRGIPIVRIFLLKDMLLAKYNTACESIYRKRTLFRTMNGIAYGVIDLFSFSAQGVGFVVGMLVMQHSKMEIGTIVFAASLMGIMADAMLSFSSFLLLVQPSIVAARRVFELLDKPIEDGRKSISKPQLDTPFTISLDNVSFSYSNGIKIIDSLNLRVKKEEHLAIVGSSGGGKTTLIKLLQAFYEPTEGDISFFDTTIKNLSLQDIRSLSAYVPQECTIFDGTIGENIGLGNPNSSISEIVEAAKQADIHEFIVSLPNGYDSIVGERGSQISGGQRQRIAIARAVLKDAPILLLDEATSALDSVSEEEIYKSLSQLIKNKTTISIAHRLSTVQNADRIIVLESGKIVEEGTHEQLLSLQGRYKELHDNQFKTQNMQL